MIKIGTDDGSSKEEIQEGFQESEAGGERQLPKGGERSKFRKRSE